MKRSGLRRRSKDGAKAERAYNRRVKQWKVENPHCKACERLMTYRPGRPVIRCTTDCHHMAGRLGAMLMDERYWLPVCRWCHDFIGEHGKLARALGFVQDAQPTGNKTGSFTKQAK
jgi:hypothetical protein